MVNYIKKHWLRLLISSVIGCSLFFFYFFEMNRYLTLDQIKAHRIVLENYINNNYLHCVIGYIGLYTLLVALVLPAAGTLTLAGGALLGFWPTLLGVTIGATAGATISFLMARYALRDIIEGHYGIYIQRLNNEIQLNGYSYMLILRLIPIMPFFIINPLVGLTQLPLITFIWTTAVGVLPGTIVFAISGQRLATIQSISDILTWESCAVLCLLALLSFIPSIINRFKIKRITT